MSKIGGKIIDGLRDALLYAEGETTRNKGASRLDNLRASMCGMCVNGSI